MQDLKAKIDELDARIEQLRAEKRELAHEYQELEAQERTQERVASMSDQEKRQYVVALGVDSGTKVNGS